MKLLLLILVWLALLAVSWSLALVALGLAPLIVLIALPFHPARHLHWRRFRAHQGLAVPPGARASLLWLASLQLPPMCRLTIKLTGGPARRRQQERSRVPARPVEHRVRRHRDKSD